MKVGLREKILGSVAVVLFVVLGISTFVSAQSVQNDYNKALVWRAGALADGLIYEVLQKHRYRLSHRINMLGLLEEMNFPCKTIYEANKRKGISHIAIIDASNRYAAHSDHLMWEQSVTNDELIRALSARQKTTAHANNLFHTIVPIITENGYYLGSIDVAMPIAVVNQRMKALFITSIATFLISLIVASVLISLLLQALVTTPLSNLVRVGKKIAKGEIHDPVITEHYEVLAKQWAKSSDEMAELTMVFVDMISYFDEMTKVAKQITKGEFSHVVTIQSEQDELGIAFREMLETLQSMSKETARLINAVQDGMLSLRSTNISYKGEWQNLINGVNDMITAFVRPINMALHYVNLISKGIIPNKVTGEYKGDFSKIKENLNSLIDTMNALLGETREMIRAVQNGNLSVKGDSQTFVGEWRELIVGINRLIDLLSAAVEKETSVTQEMKIAKDIQTGLLPEVDHFRSYGFEISGNMTTAAKVGGDYYDVIPSPDGRLWFIIGDVCGHGVTAGLVMMMAQTAIQTVLYDAENLTPSALLTKINRTITRNVKKLRDDRYMTMTALVIDRDKTATYAGCHQNILIHRAETNTIDVVKTKGIWIGLVEDINGKNTDERFSLKKGDTMLLYTDGITEARIKGTLSRKEMFGTKGLVAALEGAHTITTDEVKERLLSLIDESYEPDDDVTFLVVRTH